jgi:gamma-glutamyltranspeptidase / glutathione hydrolase
MAFRECRLGMVVGPHPLTAEAGLEMLQAGGNAFDAAVAAAFTEAVVEPSHNGIGGYGGAAVCFHAAERRVVCVDYNTEAPAAARPDMFTTEPSPDGVYRVSGTVHAHGPMSVGVPGIVAGLEEIHRSWGALPHPESIPQLLGPAIRAARDGWECNRITHNCLRENAEGIRAGFPETATLLTLTEGLPQAGERLSNPQLARTLERLASAGLRDFYTGEIAGRIVDCLQERGGILTREDLAAYRARHVETTSMAYRGRVLHTPPVGCGGITTFQILRVLEGFDLSDRLPGTAAFYHLFAAVIKACWRRRLVDLGDPAFTGVPEAGQLDPALISDLRQEARAELEAPRPGTPIAPDPYYSTSHICAADAAGNVVSLTQTHGAAFGSWVSVPETGLILGHGMARFEPRPGWSNSIAPGKRPLHNMAPMLVLQEGSPVAAYGTPGGRTIVNNQAYFTLGLFAFGLDLGTTLAAPRLHCEEAEPLKLEERAGEAVFEELRAMGHQVRAVERNGGPAHGILIGGHPTELHGATDPRGDGKVAAQ